MVRKLNREVNSVTSDGFQTPYKSTWRGLDSAAKFPILQRVSLYDGRNPISLMPRAKRVQGLLTLANFSDFSGRPDGRTDDPSAPHSTLQLSD